MKFVKLTDTEGRAFFLHASRIICFSRDTRSTTRIEMQEGLAFYAVETVEEIGEMLLKF